MVNNDIFEIEPDEEPESDGSLIDTEIHISHVDLGAEHDPEVLINGNGVQGEPIVPDLKEVIENNNSFSNSNEKIDLLSRSDTVGSIWNEVSIENIDPLSALSDIYTIEVHGTPDVDIAFWDQQDDPNSCAVATTNMMFRSLGLDPGESGIADVFEDMGIYDPASGTNPYLIDEVINHVAENAGINIQANEINGFTEETLIEMLEKGIRPMVGVDVSELYDDFWIPPDSGHAVQVTGIINTQEDNFVVINDPGFEEGAGQTIPLDRFMSAADDFGFTAVSITVV